MIWINLKKKNNKKENIDQKILGVIGIKLYLKSIIKNDKSSGLWKFQLTITINFLSSKDNDEERVMVSMSDNIEIMIYGKADAVIEEIFYSLLKRYQIGLEISMKDSKFYL